MNKKKARLRNGSVVELIEVNEKQLAYCGPIFVTEFWEKQDLKHCDDPQKDIVEFQRGNEEFEALNHNEKEGETNE